MKKTIFISLMMLTLLVVSVMGYDSCGETLLVGRNCTMQTPFLVCSNVSYAIINATSHLVVINDSPSAVIYGIYQFNISLPRGDYIVKLCDASTRELSVTYEDDNLSLAAIILIPLIMAGLLLWISMSLDEKHLPIKILLMLLTFIFIFVAMHWGLIVVSQLYGLPILQNAIGDTMYWFAIIFGVIMLYIILYIVFGLLKSVSEARRERRSG